MFVSIAISDKLDQMLFASGRVGQVTDWKYGWERAECIESLKLNCLLVRQLGGEDFHPLL